MYSWVYWVLAIALTVGLAAMGARYIAREDFGSPALQGVYGMTCALVLAVCLMRCRPARETLGFYGLMPILMLIALEDIRVKRIANRLLTLLLVIGVAAVLTRWDGMVVYLGAMAIYGGVFMLVSLASKGAFGMGDAKLCGVVALYFGLAGMFSVLFLASLFTCAAGIVTAIATRDLKREIPFAPAMALAVTIVLAAGWIF